MSLTDTVSRPPIVAVRGSGSEAQKILGRAKRTTGLQCSGLGCRRTSFGRVLDSLLCRGRHTFTILCFPMEIRGWLSWGRVAVYTTGAERSKLVFQISQSRWQSLAEKGSKNNKIYFPDLTKQMWPIKMIIMKKLQMEPFGKINDEQCLGVWGHCESRKISLETKAWTHMGWKGNTANLDINMVRIWF